MKVLEKSEKSSARNGIGRRHRAMIFVRGVRDSATACRATTIARVAICLFWQSGRFNAHNIGRKPYDLLEKFGFAEIDFFLGGNYVED